jgi:heme exporter protein CcmD
VILATHAGYIAAAWGASLAVLAAYALRTVRRGRSLSRRVPPEDRRWS